MRQQLSKIAFTAGFVLAMAFTLSTPAMAQCNGKTVAIQLPSGWGTTVYVSWEGQAKSFTATATGGGWYEFTLSGLANDGPTKQEMIFYNSSNTYSTTTSKIGAQTWNTTELLMNLNERISCSAFGSSDKIYVSEDQTNPGKTLVEVTPPKAKFFYFLPPNESKWIAGTPYLKVGNTTVRMSVDEKCGWYKVVYGDGVVPSGDASISIGSSGTDKIGPFNLQEKFGTASDLYFVSPNSWSQTDPGVNGVCSYSFTAKIYYKGSTGNSFSHYGENLGSEEGVCKGYVKPNLVNGKMEWAGINSCNKLGWANQADFENAFKKTSTNYELFYDMPFSKRPNGLWEFNSLYLCKDGTVDYSGNCASGRVGGFYLPDNVFAAAGVEKGRTYNGDFGAKLKSCFNRWCYDRGWIGGSCSDMSEGVSSMEKGNLAGLTTKAQIDAEMAKYCQRPVAQGDFVDYGSWLEFGGSTPSGVTGLLCFESVPATFTYEPGQEFFFSGDDDIWVFINNKLVIDLGGTHAPAPGYVNLDTLGLTQGSEYPINVFFCDRRGPASNVHISTNIFFAQPSSPIGPKIYNVANANKMQLIKNGVLLHSAKNTYLEIFSLNGKLLRKMNFANGTYSVELSDLPKGLYIVKANFGNSKEVLRIPVM